MKSSFQAYWESGRGPSLLRFAALSCGIAAVEWLPGKRQQLSDQQRSAGVALSTCVLALLPVAWLVTICIGIKRSGWAGLILLLPVKWGMFFWIMVVVALLLSEIF
jgi:hypothetical protein